MGILNRTIEISYFDHNETFKTQLPRRGTVTQRLASKNVDNWYLIALDRAVEWQVEQYRHILVRSRWREMDIGPEEPVSVFILLVQEEALPLTEPIDPETYVHVAWGMAEVIEDGTQS
jgi:hypothetical protein